MNKAILFLHVIILSTVVLAQTQNLRFEQLSTDDGLSQSSITAIIQDRYGFMWFGTLEGLNRYDGYSVKVYYNNPSDSTSISSNLIRSIYEDKFGNLWIGTQGGGFNKYNRKSDNFSSYTYNPDDSNSISSDVVYFITGDKDGNLWLGTLNGLNYFNTKTYKFTRYFHDENNSNSLSYNVIYSILVDESDNVWVGTPGGGVNRFNRKNNLFERFHQGTSKRNIDGERVYTIFEDSEKNIWIGTDKALHRKVQYRDEFIRYYNVVGNENNQDYIMVFRIAEDINGNLWLALNGGGISKVVYTNETQEISFHNFRNDSNDPFSINTDECVNIYCSRDGLIWIGTLSMGLNVANPEKSQFGHYYHIQGNKNSISSNMVTDFAEDEKGNIWINTFKGLNKFNRKAGQFEHIYANSPNSNYLICSLFDDSGILWLGTAREGLHKYDLKTNKISQYLNNEGNLSSLGVMALHKDSMDRLWVGTNGGGLYILDIQSGKIHNFLHNPEDSNSLSNNYIYTISEDRLGNLWLGTFLGGLNKVIVSEDTSGNDYELSFKKYFNDSEDPNSVSSNSISMIYLDGKGECWIGTYDAGFNKLIMDETGNDIQFKRYSDKDGLANNAINSIQEDDNGNIWLATNKGLSNFNPISEKFVNYDFVDGLQGNEFFGTSCFKANDGTLFFGGTNGFNMFNPKDIEDNHTESSVVITDFKLFNQNVKIDPERNDTVFALPAQIIEVKELVLSYKEDVFSFGFSSMNYASPYKIKYAYKMEGFNDSWIETDASKRFAQFTNLNDGEYIFKVRATDKHGRWSENAASLNIRITPPPWDTWWAYTLYLIFIVSAILFAHRTRTRSLKKRQKELEDEVVLRTKEVVEAKNIAEAATEAKSKFLATMSHEIRNPMNAIIGLTHLALGTKLDDKQKDYISKTHASSKNLLGIINDILDFSKIEAGKLDIETIPFDLYKVMDDIRDVFIFKTEEKGIGFNIKQDEKVPRYLMGDPLRIGQILTNFVSNAIKFTSEGSVTINAEFIKGDDNRTKLKLSVTDTGLGMTPEQVGKMFKSYSQADKSTSRKFGGTGLGLSITKHLAELMKGEVGVESKQGKGSTFYFIAEFEICKDTAQFEADDSDLISTKFPGVRVLLAEDNEINQQVASEIMRGADIEVITADNGKIALDKVKDSGVPSNYHLLFIDLQMPEMDGITATKEIRKIKVYDGLPIVAMSADVMEGVRDECINAGMNDFITKPIEPKEVLEMINKWVDKEKVESPKEKEEIKSPALSGEHEIQRDSSGISIPELDAIDSAEGLKRVGGNKKLYLDLLEKFYKGNQNFKRELSDALEKGDPELSERIVHTLKGVSGNLGVTQLHIASKELEAIIKDDIKKVKESDIEKVNNILLTVLMEIGEKLNLAQKVSVSKSVQLGEVQDKIKVLKQKLEEYDPESWKIFEEIGTIEGYEIECNQVSELIKNYDFDEALEILKKLK